MPKNISRTSLVKNVTIYSTYLIIIWAFYRFLFQFPDNIEELIIKPILWLLPLYFIISKERLGLSSIGLTLKNFFPAIYLSLGLGAIFVLEGLLANFLKYGHFNFAANIGASPIWASLGVSFATAFSEEISFRGYIFNRLGLALKNELLANIIQTILWTAIHVPIALFILNLGVTGSVVYLTITAIFGLGSAFLFARTGNVWGSILLHVLWEWPIILFR